MSTKGIQKEEPLGKVISTRYFFFGYLILLSCLDCKFHLFNSVEKSCLSYEVSGKNGTTLTCRSFSVYTHFFFVFLFFLSFKVTQCTCLRHSVEMYFKKCWMISRTDLNETYKSY